MNLSPHFTYEELTRTDTTFPNVPDEEQLNNLRVTAGLMEGVRTQLLGRAIFVNSGFRSPEVNQAVRGVPTSAHCFGYAVDFTCPDFGTPYAIAWSISSSRLNFDQLILEYGWVHISFDPHMRRMLLTKKSPLSPYEEGLVT